MRHQGKEMTLAWEAAVSLGLPCRVASAFGEHLACEHLDQPRGPRWKVDLPRENLLWAHSPTVILGIRVVSCANHCPFQRVAGKQTLTKAAKIDYGHPGDRGVHILV